MIFFGNKIKNFNTKFKNLDSLDTFCKVENLNLTIDKKISRGEFEKGLKKIKGKYKNLNIKNKENIFEEKKSKVEKNLLRRFLQIFS